nr:Chain C, Melanoma inhibitory activity protein 3 [Homo sapiens]5KYU_C Chain C, TANGO1 peptide2 [Homo sapiens]
GPRPLPPP